MADEEKQQSAQPAEATASEGSLVDEILAATRLQPQDEAYSVTKAGVQAFIDEMLKPGREGQKVQSSIADEMIASIDQKLSAQVSAILHNPDFQKMESSWRSLKFLVDRTDFRENIKISVLNCQQAGFVGRFRGCAGSAQVRPVPHGLFRGIRPVRRTALRGHDRQTMILARGPQDMKLLGYVAAVSTMSHAPFIAAAGPQFFGVDSFEALPGLKDLHSIMEMPQYTKWQSFRASEDARYVGHDPAQVPVAPALQFGNSAGQEIQFQGRRLRRR